MKFKFLIIVMLCTLCNHMVQGQECKPFPQLKALAGNTHAHSIYSYSHGAHLKKNKDFKKGDIILYIDSLRLNRPINFTLKQDWYTYQNTPAVHFSTAKKAGFDFYCLTDHSQEPAFYPTEKNNVSWLISKASANQASDGTFTGILGYEHSENDGPDGKGHYNVLNSSTYLNALQEGVDIAYFYNWLKENPININDNDPVVVSFNHPSPDQYDSFDYLDDEIDSVISLFEILNGKRVLSAGFTAALDKGWKVSPVAGIDNHDLAGITESSMRTFVLSKKNTKRDILMAMHSRRTYASLDTNLDCRYSVNDSLMGSLIPSSGSYNIKIYINDPDTSIESDKISKVDIITKNGRLAKSIVIDNPKYAVCLNESVSAAFIEDYFYIKIWDNVPDTDKPVAWLAPVWIDK